MARIIEKEIGVKEASTLLPTTIETVLVSARVRIPTATARVMVRALAIISTGAGTTGLTLRIRDGNTAAGTLRGGGHVLGVQAAVPGVEQVMVQAVLQVANAAEYQACVTAEQGGAPADGTSHTAYLEMEVLNG